MGSETLAPIAVPAVTRHRGPQPGKVLAIASLGAAVAFIDATIVNIAFPDIERSFPGTSISTLSWVLNAYNIVFAAFLVAAGRLADLLGRRRMFVFGLELFTVGSLLCAIAPSPAALIVFRVIQALGAALLVPSSLALVLNAFPAGRRSHGVTMLSAVGAGAAGLGPSLGGVLITIASWRLVFLVNLPVGVAAAVLARRLLVESRTPGRRRMPDLFGAVLFALAVAALVLGVVEGQQWGWLSWRILGSFAAAAALAAVFVWRCTWHASPIIDLALLRIRTFSAANAMSVIGAAGFYGYTLTNVLFLTGVWRYTVLQAGLALTIGPVVAVAVAGRSSRLADRIGHRALLVAGAALWGAAITWFVARTGLEPDFVGVWLPGMVLLGIGAGITFPNLSAAAVASAPGESFATATGMNSVARQVGAALGVALVVAILGTPSPAQLLNVFHHAWAFGAACMFAVAIGCILIGRVEGDPEPFASRSGRVVQRDLVPDDSFRPLVPRAHRAIEIADLQTSSEAQSAADFLGAVPLFSGLGDELRAQLATRSRNVEVMAGEWLFREGDAGDALYVVRAGRFEVLDESSGVVIRELGRGDALGELALLIEAPRSASVRAARRGSLLAIDRVDFQQLLESSPQLSRGMNRVLAAQLRDSRAPAPRLRPRAVTVAIVGLQEQAPPDELAVRLFGELGRLVPAELLTRPDRIDADPSSFYAPALDLAEATHELVLLSGGSVLEADDWTEFCIQQADRILAVTGGGSIPAALAGRADLRGCELVIHDVARSDGGLEGWADMLDPVESHVISTASLDDDLGRLARRLTGHSVGLVLSGGGARAFAHIGVIEELAAAGVRIDRVIGVSMGAVVGALFASGLDAEQIDRICFEEWVQRRPLADYTIPRYALIRGERVRAMLRRMFGGTLVEELPRSFMCAYTELRSGQLIVARHGPLWERVGFSICLPVIAPPQVRGRQMYVDGSLTDNLPVGTMAELAEGPIIAVDVRAGFGEANPRAPVRERLPSLGETLARVLLLGSANTSESARRHADLVIRPRSDGVGLLEFHQLDAAREAGRAAAAEALEHAPSALFSGAAA